MLAVWITLREPVVEEVLTPTLGPAPVINRIPIKPITPSELRNEQDNRRIIKCPVANPALAQNQFKAPPTVGVSGSNDSTALLFKGIGRGQGAGLTGTVFSNPGPRPKSVAFVIDASGSMLDTMPLVISELKRTLRQLDETQTFTVVFYQDGQAVEPLSPGLKQASRENLSRMFAWLDGDDLAPAGLSHPLAAVQQGLRYKPQLLFMLSDNITGRGRYEIDQATLLKQIDQANAGKTKINTLQFIYPDPLERQGMIGTMKLIAQRSGGLYRFISAADLGLDEASAATSARAQR